jgi:uncharacterized protein YndB with AHSA1/START domain
MDLSPEEQSKTVINSRIIEAPIVDVFDAYANPEKIVRWWGPQGFTLINESIDLREGGHWLFVFKGPDGKEYKNHQVFAKIERPHLFAVDHVINVPVIKTHFQAWFTMSMKAFVGMSHHRTRREFHNTYVGDGTNLFDQKRTSSRRRGVKRDLIVRKIRKMQRTGHW